MKTALSASSDADVFQLMKPAAEDGQEIWRLIKDTGVLDLNSAYSYIMLSDLFAETCVLARDRDGVTAGFVSAFITPNKEDTLFIWQIAVNPSCQGRGLGLKLLMSLLERESCSSVRYAELTIAPTNRASDQLFRRFAERLHAPLHISSGYPREWFPGGGHEDEKLYRIGPIDR